MNHHFLTLLLRPWVGFGNILVGLKGVLIDLAVFFLIKELLFQLLLHLYKFMIGLYPKRQESKQ